MYKAALLMSTILLSSHLLAQTSAAADQENVQQTIRNVFDALSNRDSIALKAACTTDVVFYEYGMTWTADSLIKRTITRNQAKDFKRTNTISFVQTTVEGNTAWATYTLLSQITREGKQTSLQWMETVILVRQNKTWKLKVLHSTLIKRT